MLPWNERTAPTMYGEMDAIGASACTTMPEAADAAATGAAAPASSVCSSAIARVAASPRSALAGSPQ